MSLATCRTVLALALFAAASCDHEPPVPSGPNVLLIAIDTLRADRLGCYGNDRGLTPNIDRLAAEGVRFENAFAHAPWTLPSFASLFTSLPPEAHGAGGNVKQGWRALDPSYDTLAEELASAGWRTGAIVNVDFLSEPFGVVQGFQEVDAQFAADNEHVRRAAPTTDAAIAWIARERKRPFFLLVHYFDPHAEYDPPAEWRARFADPRDRDNQGFRFGTREHVVLARTKKLALDKDMLARAERLYDAEVAYTDAQIGRLLDDLRARGLERDTLVVLTSDHGEEFLDHGDWEHGHNLYDELLRVPLIARRPGKIAPRAIADAVGLVDVAPTVCAAISVPIPRQFSGRDLSPLLEGRAIAPPALLSFGSFWGAPLEGWRDASMQLIRKPEAKLELYDWRADPRQRKDLSPADANAARERSTALDVELRAKGWSPPRAGAPVRLDAAARSRLGAVGYTEGDEHR